MTEILHVITTLDRGGAENQLLLLVREQIKIGHKVSIFPLKGKLELERQFRNYGATVVKPQINKSPLTQIRALRSFTKSVQIVHAHLPRAELVTFFGSRERFFISRHNCEPFFPTYPGILSIALSRMVQTRARKVIGISNTVRNYLITRGEIVGKEISVVNYGFDKSIKYDDVTSVPHLEGELIIGTVSRLVPQKDLKTLIRAFGIVNENFPQIRLAIVGEGNLQIELENLARELKIFKAIDWFGRTSDPLKFMAQMDLFIMSSIYEGFGLVVLEAISQGVPVIASDNDTFEELFEGQKENLFITGDPGSLALKIIQFLPMANRRALTKKQLEVLEKYSLARMIHEMELLYQEAKK
jgi:glycosyltransferase involved in cell wall biosynthesis